MCSGLVWICSRRSPRCLDGKRVWLGKCGSCLGGASGDSGESQGPAWTATIRRQGAMSRVIGGLW